MELGMLNETNKGRKVILDWCIRPVAKRELYSWREQVLIQYTQSLTDARVLYKYQADPQPSPGHHVTTRCMCWESLAKIFLRATNNLQKSHRCLASHTVGYRLLGDNMKNVLHNRTKKKEKGVHPLFERHLLYLLYWDPPCLDSAYIWN